MSESSGRRVAEAGAAGGAGGAGGAHVKQPNNNEGPTKRNK